MDRIGKLNEFLQLNPGDSFVRHALALEYVKIGDDLAARKLFEEVLAKDPSYVGTYYHLAKLLERNNAPEQAIQWYEKGMEQAKKLKDDHAWRELRGAYEELTL